MVDTFPPLENFERYISFVPLRIYLLGSLVGRHRVVGANLGITLVGRDRCLETSSLCPWNVWSSLYRPRFYIHYCLITLTGTIEHFWPVLLISDQFAGLLQLASRIKTKDWRHDPDELRKINGRMLGVVWNISICSSVIRVEAVGIVTIRDQQFENTVSSNYFLCSYYILSLIPK